MGKVIDLGSISQNDPIYGGNPIVHLRSPVPSKSIKNLKEKKLREPLPSPTQSGRFCVVYVYDSWEGGECLQDEIRQPVVFETLETAEKFLEIKWCEITASLEVEVAKISKMKTHSMQGSGYTVYGLVAESVEVQNQESWKSFFGVEDPNEGDTSSSIRKFVGFDCEPGRGGAIWSSREYSDIQDQLAMYFYLS